MARGATALVLAVLLAACGANGAPPPASEPPASGAGTAGSAAPPSLAAESPSPSATPTQDEVREAAADAYLAAVKPFNKAIKAIDKKYQNATSLKANRAYCKKLADVTRTWLLALKAIEFPTDTKADAKRLMKYEAATEAHLKTCGSAKNWARWNRYWDLAIGASDKAREAANLVRLDLGLPGVPD